MKKRFLVIISAVLALSGQAVAQPKSIKPVKSVNADKSNPKLNATVLKQNQKNQMSTEKPPVVHNEIITSDNIQGFLETENGLLYRFERKGNSQQAAKENDLALLHVQFYMGDSLIFDTKKINGNQPVPEHIKAPVHRGDVKEGIMMMKPGDVAIFKTTLEEFAAQNKNPIPPYVKNGKYATWKIEMTDIKTKEEIKAEEEKLILQEEEEIKAYLSKNKLKGERLPSGVYIVTHQEGTGPNPKAGQKVSVNYTGKLMDGKVFDSNIDPKFNHVTPFEFKVGNGKVIKGWDAGFLSMQKGQKATLYIPSSLAYGKNSPTPAIPANSILVFDVELLDIIE